MNRTVLDLCFRVAGRTTWYVEIAEIQGTIDRGNSIDNDQRHPYGCRLLQLPVGFAVPTCVRYLRPTVVVAMCLSSRPVRRVHTRPVLAHIPILRIAEDAIGITGSWTRWRRESVRASGDSLVRECLLSILSGTLSIASYTAILFIVAILRAAVASRGAPAKCAASSISIPALDRAIQTCRPVGPVAHGLS
jgi:hypothetical protein